MHTRPALHTPPRPPAGNAGLAALAQGGPGGARAALRTLNLTDTGVTDPGLESLVAAFPHLESLCLLYCAGITDHGARHLAGLKRLKKLNLDSRDITDAALLHLSSLRELRHLDLFSARVSDVGLCFLSALASLTGARARAREGERLGF